TLTGSTLARSPPSSRPTAAPFPTTAKARDTTGSAGRRPSPIHFHPKNGAGDSVPGSAASLGYTPSPLGPPAPIFVGLPSLQTFEPRLASPDVSFYCLFTKAIHRP